MRTLSLNEIDKVTGAGFFGYTLGAGGAGLSGFASYTLLANAGSLAPFPSLLTSVFGASGVSVVSCAVKACGTVIGVGSGLFVGLGTGALIDMAIYLTQDHSGKRLSSASD